MEEFYMWLAGGLALALLGLNFKFIAKKQDKSTCNTIEKTFKESLERGDKKFETILDEQKAIRETLQTHGEILAGQGKSLEWMAKSLDKIANGK